MLLISAMNPLKLAILAAILGLFLSDDLDADEINTMGNFIVGTGCIMLIVAAQKQFLISQQERTSADSEALERLTARIRCLEQTWAACFAGKA